MLRRLGVRREERVAMIMLDTVDFPAVFLGAIRAGVVPVPLNTLLTSDQYAYVLADCRARVLFISEALLPVVKDMVGRMSDLDHVIVVRQATRMATRNCPTNSRAKAISSPPSRPMPTSRRSGCIRRARPACPRACGICMPTSPRPRTPMRRQVLGIREDDVGLSAAKLFFAYGLGNALTFPMSVGATTVLNSERPTPASMFALMNKYNPTIFFGVPTLFSSMLHDEALKNERGGTRLRICTSAGEALPESVGNAWKARFGVDILDGVGSTELLHIFLSNSPGDIKYGTSGRPVPGYKVRLVNEAGNEVADGEVGELLVRCAVGRRGLLEPAQQEPPDLRGPLDPHRRQIHSRCRAAATPSAAAATTCSRCRGIWVSPFEVESALITHPAVLEAAVVPEADPEGLLKPKAFVVLRAGANTEGLHDALKEYVKQKIGVWKYPRWIDVVDSLPKTATGEDPALQVAGRGKVAETRWPPRVVPAKAGPIPRDDAMGHDGGRLQTTQAGGYGSLLSQARRGLRIAFGKLPSCKAPPASSPSAPPNSNTA